jgi:hypothetical protein
MNKICVICFLLMFLSGCDNNSNDFQTVLPNARQCIEPQNPYDEDSGHYAGYEWAMENGGGCSGNSESFNEGCEEYYRQINQYDKCMSSR